MSDMNDKLAMDLDLFGESIIKKCVMIKFHQRLWGAWKVITGEAGIVLIRVCPKKKYK